MDSNKPKRLTIGRRVFYSLIENFVSLLGGILVFTCFYWFFHFETWHERCLYIFLTIIFIYFLVKILPNRPEQ